MDDDAEIVEERELAAVVALLAALAGAATLLWVVALAVALALTAMALGVWAAARGERHVLGSIAVGVGAIDVVAGIALWVG